MTNTGLQTFDKTVQKTNEILSDIENKLGWKNRREQSYSTLRIVLHALRNRLAINDAANFAAQFTILLKGIYFDGWDPANVPKKLNKEEFIDKIQNKLNYSVKDINKVIKTVLNTIFESVDQDIEDNLRETLPKEIANLW